MLKLQEHIVTVVVEGASEGERKVFRGEWQKYLHSCNSMPLGAVLGLLCVN